MQRLRIAHLTDYRYSSPVTLGPHWLLLRPREGHDVHIESSRLDISPHPQIKWHRDMFDNSVAVAIFGDSSDRLSIEILGVLNGTAEGPLAIGVLALIALTATRRLWRGR